MVPFVIVADLRTGSTLLQSSLNRHPDVRCYGELFHPDDFPDNRIDGYDRHQAPSGREIVKRVWTEEGVWAAGFRAMVSLPTPSHPHWADSWDALRECQDLRVVWLTRRDRLAQYVSMLVALETRVWHPSPDDPVLRPENRPRVTVDPDQFRAWVEERDGFYELRRGQLSGKPALQLDYEALTADWPATIRGVQEFLEVEPLPLEQWKHKQERRPLSEVVANYGQLVAENLCPPREP